MLGKDITLAIAGNKVDLNRIVSLEEAEAYAASVGAKHFSTSAKINQGVEDLFLDLAKRKSPLERIRTRQRAHRSATGMLTVRGETKASSRPTSYSAGGPILLGVEEPQAPPNNEGCC